MPDDGSYNVLECTAALAAALDGVTIGEPVAWHGLTVYPLHGAADTEPSYMTFGPARDAGTFRITEVSDAGIVGELEAVNDGDVDVLLLDGEEVVGAKQNRMINLTILVPARSRARIPVSCVEQGRWSMKQQAFADSGRAVFARERARKTRDVNASMRASGVARADQGAVWFEVAARLNDYGVASDTMAMSAMYEQRGEDLESYVEALRPQPGQVGAAFGTGGRIVGLELFDSPSGYRASADKIVRSYAADVIGGTAHDEPLTEVSVRTFMQAILATTPDLHAATGAGVHARFDSDTHVGAALLHGGRVLHMMAFATEAPRHGTDATALIRTGRMHCAPAAVFSRRPPSLHTDAARLRDRVEGMLLGLAIGDALGNTTEGMTPAQRRSAHGEVRDYLPHRAAGNARVGLPSDDTQLAFRTVRRLLEDGDVAPERIARDFCARRIFGIGHTVRAFIRAFKDEGRPWHDAGQPSAGNGALMRIAPAVLPHLRAPSPALWSDAAVLTMITHNDPAAIGASVAFVDLLWRLLGSDSVPPRGGWLEPFVSKLREVEDDAPRYTPNKQGLGGPTSLWSFTQRHVSAALDADLDAATACNSWYSGAYLLETVPSVLYILERHGHDPEEAIVRAVNDTKDNDTVAAIVGAAVGALHGRSALPERWLTGLAGRTEADDDGELFHLVGAATHAFVR